MDLTGRRGIAVAAAAAAARRHGFRARREREGEGIEREGDGKLGVKWREAAAGRWGEWRERGHRFPPSGWGASVNWAGLMVLIVVYGLGWHISLFQAFIPAHLTPTHSIQGSSFVWANNFSQLLRPN